MFDCPVPREAASHYLTDVALVPAYDRVVLETTFRKINSWAIDTLRSAVHQSDDALREGEARSNMAPADFIGGLSLGAMPFSRFLLASLGILTNEHNAGDVSLILNSGVLGLSQTVMRLAGPCDVNEEEAPALAAIIDEAKATRKHCAAPLTGPEVARLMKVGTRVVRGPDWKWGDQVRIGHHQVSLLFAVFYAHF